MPKNLSDIDTQMHELTTYQSRALGECVVNILDDTEDWQLPSEEFRQAIQSWVDILKGLKQDDFVTQVINDYKHICELT